MYILQIIFLCLLIAIILFCIFAFTVNTFVASRLWRGDKVSDHFDGKRFYNIGWTRKESLKLEAREDGRGNKFTAILEWLIKRKPRIWEKRAITPIIPAVHYDGDGMRMTFVGHATMLIQVNNINILTDPVWADRTSPFSWAGPHRYVEPGIDFDQLPEIHIVLLSHNHYDHMDLDTLRRLEKKNNPMIYTGLGNKKYLQDRGITQVEEMDWQETQISTQGENTVKITFVPAQHFSARGITDRNKTLWGGFVCDITDTQGAYKSFYFAGDTGYGDAFIDTIKQQFPAGFDIGLLPIGAYKPRWFMAPVHVSPEEALKMQKELKITTAIGIHWGTFPLADDNQDDPLIDLNEAKSIEVYKNLDFRTGPNGTVWTLTSTSSSKSLQS